MNLTKPRAAVLLAVLASTAGVVAMARKPAPQGPLSPSALAVSRGAKSLFVACATGRQVIELDLASRKIVRKLTVPGEPSGLALSPDGARLYVTCAAPASVVAVVDVAAGRVLETIPAGHTANSPVVSPDGALLFVSNRFNDDVGVIDLKARTQLRRIRVERKPVSAALTRDGKLLLVANHLQNGRADVDRVAAAVSVVDPYAGKVVKTLRLPNGSGQLQQIQVSPDGKYAVVTHILARYQTPTSQIDRGWMNTNAISIIDIATLSLVNTVLLDGPFNGAANPWGVAWSPDGRQLVATHAGAHEVSIIEFPALLEKLAAAEAKADVPDDLAFLSGLRQTVRLREIDRGPRAVAVAGGGIYTANYFSDSLSAIDMAAPGRHPESLPLGPRQTAGLVRQGEFYFHDAGICFQRWQSCASCHPGDARTDALNWDLLNDGIGNPKNSRSLLLAHRTPPAMSLGIRDTAETAVRSGIRYILFTQQPPEVALALDAYLKSLKPVPSPYLVNGKLSEAATRGRALFNDPVVGCGSCHPGGVFTDLKSYDVGTTPGRERLDTPTLIEVWRTAPYLHDGSAARIRDVLTTKNAQDKHGKTSHLTLKQIEDLVEYILSL
jgi:YVTN family beta-propeller protein